MVEIKVQTGLPTKILKGACFLLFPAITTVCVSPFCVNDFYKVYKSYQQCKKARKNMMIEGNNTGLINISFTKRG